MSDDNRDILLQGLITTTGIAMAARALARELLLDVARLQPDPQAYVGALYGRVISHLDPDEVLRETQALALARDLAGAIFRDVEAALRAGSTGGRSPRSSTPR